MSGRVNANRKSEMQVTGILTRWTPMPSRGRCSTTTVGRSRRSSSTLPIWPPSQRSPNTVRVYATNRKLWFEFLAQVDVGWAEAGVDDVAAEAALDARDASRREGLRRRSAEGAELARRLTEKCEGAHSPAQRSEPEHAALTGRKREVATLAARGLTNQEIAGRLGLSRRMVENHLQHAFDKLAVASRGELHAAAGSDSARRRDDHAAWRRTSIRT